MLPLFPYKVIGPTFPPKNMPCNISPLQLPLFFLQMAGKLHVYKVYSVY
jgi:hypothetical protein